MRRRAEQGQAMVETVMAFVLVTAAIVLLAFYVQRAIQGNVFQGASSLGLQFDPARDYTETQRLTRFNEHTDVTTAAGMVAAPLMAGPDDCSLLGPVGVANGCLPNIPTGSVPRETAGIANMNVTTTWHADNAADYQTSR